MANLVWAGIMPALVPGVPGRWIQHRTLHSIGAQWVSAGWMNAVQRRLAHIEKTRPTVTKIQVRSWHRPSSSPSLTFLQCLHAIDPPCLHLGFRIVRVDRNTHPGMRWPWRSPSLTWAYHPHLLHLPPHWSCGVLVSGGEDSSGKMKTTPCNCPLFAECIRAVPAGLCRVYCPCLPWCLLPTSVSPRCPASPALLHSAVASS